MKNFQCENCGAAMTIADDALTATCEYCGTMISIPDTHPEYAEAMFEKMVDELEQSDEETEGISPRKMPFTLIMILIGVIMVTAFSIIVCEFVLFETSPMKMGYVSQQDAQYSWPATGNAVLLPQPPTEYGEIMSDTEAHFSASIYQVTEDDFSTYTAKCIESGFDIAAEGSESSYYAYNAEGYCIDLFYWEEDDELNIYLDAPEEIMEFAWPTTGLAANLPKPDSDYGRVIFEDGEEVSILVYVESKSEFDQYVEECKKHGFTENHEFYFTDNKNGWYEADHRNGYHLDLDYNDSYYKKMEIRLDVE